MPLVLKDPGFDSDNPDFWKSKMLYLKPLSLVSKVLFESQHLFSVSLHVCYGNVLWGRTCTQVHTYIPPPHTHPLLSELEEGWGSFKCWGKKEHRLVFQSTVLPHLWRITHSHSWSFSKGSPRDVRTQDRYDFAGCSSLCHSPLFCLSFCNSKMLAGSSTTTLWVEFSRVQRMLWYLVLKIAILSSI